MLGGLVTVRYLVITPKSEGALSLSLSLPLTLTLTLPLTLTLTRCTPSGCYC